jgi:hypothetical protein
MLEKWHRFLKRPPDERSAILRAMIFLPLIEIGLRTFGFRRLTEMIARFPAGSYSSHSPLTSPQQEGLIIMRAVRSAELHGITTPNCLERSITLWWLLRRAGIPSELRIGARKNDSRFEAHAWIELDGQVLNDSPEVHAHYARFDAPIAAADSAWGAEHKERLH